MSIEDNNNNNGQTNYFLNNESNVINENQGNDGSDKVFVYRYIILKAPVTPIDVLPFIIFFGCWCLAIHSILSVIKRCSKNAHKLIQFIFVLAFPPIVMIISQDFIIILIWIILNGFCLYCLRIAFSRTLLRANNPKKIYRIFKEIFTYTNIFIITGQGIFLISFFFNNHKGMKLGFRWLVYSLYFAVYCREVMSSLSIIMGKTSGVIALSPLGQHEEDLSKCMICCESLMNMQGKVFTNSCGHSFHNSCIKGWYIIGSKDYCISCKEGLNVELIKPDFWMRAEVSAKPMMNFLRSSIAFFVVSYIFIILRSRN